jgi:cell filamentation protein
MALQAGLPILDFSIIRGPKKKDYFTSVQIGLGRDYQPMEKLFEEIIEASIQALSEK